MLGAEFERLDVATREHSVRVSNYSAIIAQAMGAPPAQFSVIATAARLHEIGKLAIPETILYKPAKLTAEEQAVLRGYSVRGYEILSQEQPLSQEAEIVYSHRERSDGNRYPRRLKGEAIPFGARIIAVADTFDLLLSDRPHRRETAFIAARDEILRWSGISFDPQIVENFVGIADETWESARAD